MAFSADFVGDSTLPGFGPSWGAEFLACTSLVARVEFKALDDDQGMLSVFLAAELGVPFVGPVPLATCVFAPDSGFPCPTAGDFVIVDAVFPDDPLPPPFPLPSAPAIAVTVSPRTDIPAGTPWAARGSSGAFVYVDASRANAGVEKVGLKQNRKGLINFLLIGTGSNLPMATPTSRLIPRSRSRSSPAMRAAGDPIS